MKIKIISFVILLSLFTAFNISAKAEIQIDKEGNYVNVDKFVPSRGVKVKNSQLAQMMEDSTRKAMNKEEREIEEPNMYDKKESEYQKYKRYTKNKQYTTVNGYRLF